eukprot:TRINITY_DN54885_c0_g1_i1.p1 TRINITY_DN54885_c0_g1~~TRINITY_DN54885_c0_g1_i1.p1  ORF type:complete len:210 (-),score=46.46 TRINITY_DN54885_c0_g1_i1:391-1020(-)
MPASETEISNWRTSFLNVPSVHDDERLAVDELKALLNELGERHDVSHKQFVATSDHVEEGSLLLEGVVKQVEELQGKRMVEPSCLECKFDVLQQNFPQVKRELGREIGKLGALQVSLTNLIQDIKMVSAAGVQAIVLDVLREQVARSNGAGSGQLATSVATLRLPFHQSASMRCKVCQEAKPKDIGNFIAPQMEQDAGYCRLCHELGRW